MTKRLVKVAVAVVVIGCIAWAVRGQLAEADFADVRPRWGWVIASALVLPFMYASILVSERLLLRAFTGRTLPWRDMVPAAWVPLAGKYVPGKIAAAGAAVVLLKRLGVPATTALGVFVLLDAMPVLTGTILGSALLLDDAVRERFPAAPLLFGGIVAVGATCLHPAVFRRITTTALRLMRRPPLPRVPGWRDYAGPLLCSLGQWAANGLAVWLMLRAFADVPAIELPRIVCVTAVVMCVSYFAAFVTFAGLGVRELAFVPLLAPLAGFEAATATAVAMRLAHTLVEVALCGVGLLVLRRPAPTLPPSG